MPFGLMFSNLVFWLIPPLRRIQEREAVGNKGTDFGSAMRQLGVFAGFSFPLGLVMTIFGVWLGG
jgi:hypothetical protein